MQKNTRCFIAALWGLIAAGGAVAQQTASDSTHWRNSLWQVPLSSGEPAALAFEQVELTERGVAHTELSEQLRPLAGLNVQPNFGVVDFFFSRGVDSRTGGLITVDGLPEANSAVFRLYNIEAVEVLRGPASFLLGDKPMTGVVNLLQKQPFWQRAIRLRGSGGSFGSTEAAIDLNLPLITSTLALRLNAVSGKTSGYRDGIGADWRAFNPVLLWQASEKTRVKVSWEFAGNRYTPDSGIPLLLAENRLPDVPRSRSWQTPSDFSEQEIVRSQAEIVHRFSPTLILRNRLWARTLDWTMRGTLATGIAPGTFGQLEVTRLQQVFDNRQRGFGNTLEAVWQRTHGENRSHLRAGVEARTLSDELQSSAFFLLPLPLADTTSTDTSPLFQLSSQDSKGITRTLAGFAVYQFARADRLRLSLGGRYDRIVYEDSRLAIDNKIGRFSPMAGVALIPGAGFELFAGAGQGFATQSTRSRRDEVPEQSFSYEAGVRYFAAESGLRADIRWFTLERSKALIPDSTGAIAPIGEQRSRGVETTLQARLAGWHLRATWTWMRSDLVLWHERVLPDGITIVLLNYSGRRAPFTPENTAALSLSRAFGRFALYLAGRYQDRQYIYPDNYHAIAASLVFDARLSVELPRWRLHFVATNVGDREYAMRGFQYGSVTPAPPRAVYFTLEFLLEK